MIKVLHFIGGNLNSGAGKEVVLLNKLLNVNKNFYSKIYNKKNFFNFFEKVIKRFYFNRQKTTFSLNIFGKNFLNSQEYKKSDIIHLHWINSSLIKISDIKKINKPIVWTLYDLWPFTGGCHYNLGCKGFLNYCGKCPQLGSKNFNDLSHLILNQKLKSYVQKKINFVSPSIWLTNIIKKSIFLKKNSIKTLSGIFDIKKFKKLNQNKCKKFLKLKTKKKIILFAADNIVAQYKGFNYFLKSLDYIDKNKYFILTFGNFWLSDLIKKKKFDHAHLGYINDSDIINKIYSASDVFVCTSIQDAFHKMSVEAMLSGTPCVYFSKTVIAERNINKITGYECQYKNSKDIAIGINFLSNNKKKYGLMARKKILNKYSINKTIGDYKKLYKNIIN